MQGPKFNSQHVHTQGEEEEEEGKEDREDEEEDEEDEEEDELGRPTGQSVAQARVQLRFPRTKQRNGTQCGNLVQVWQEALLRPVQVTLASAGDLWPQAKG